MRAIFIKAHGQTLDGHVAVFTHETEDLVWKDGDGLESIGRLNRDEHILRHFRHRVDALWMTRISIGNIFPFTV